MSFADYLERHWGIDSEDYEPEHEHEGDDNGEISVVPYDSEEAAIAAAQACEN